MADRSIEARGNRLRPVVWGGAAFLAYGATMVGFGLWSHLLSRRPAAQVAPFSLLVPVFGQGLPCGLLPWINHVPPAPNKPATAANTSALTCSAGRLLSITT